MGDHETLINVAKRWEAVAAELKAENALLKQSNARFFDDVVALRAALQALVDAMGYLHGWTVSTLDVDVLDAARRRAVGLLEPEEGT